MVDFHSHILPGMDDGADSLRTSLAMLRESARQSVDILCATPHFSADEDDVVSFLGRREEAFAYMRSVMKKAGGEAFPEIRLGAEVRYFPGLSEAKDIRDLCLEGTPFLLIDPPTAPWSDDMLDEIERCVVTLRCVPVIAHIDRRPAHAHPGKWEFFPPPQEQGARAEALGGRGHPLPRQRLLQSARPWAEPGLCGGRHRRGGPGLCSGGSEQQGAQGNYGDLTERF